MVLRAAIFFAILVNLQFSSSLEDESFSDVSQPLGADDHKILQECHNEDYRTYLRCLKRHKRQHNDNTGSTKSCLEDCTAKNCTSSKCVHDCYTRCKKKITETYSKVTETEFECSEGHCDKNSSVVPNITTNVNINIDLNRDLNETKGAQNPTTNPTTKSLNPNFPDNDSSKITINNLITNHPGSGNSNCACPGCNCFPWPIFPEILVSIGPGTIGGGCCYPQPCTCNQQSQKNIDCSSCATGHPFLRYKCETTCYNLNQTVTSPTTTTPKSFYSRSGN